ncbi:MAG TPA: NnrS family protein [Myxococcota bacterium]|nr:NnrS family protein [Myxococcota bacterium]
MCTRPPLLSSGFRPFFLLASTAGAVLLASWLAALAGWWGGDAAWHGHELIFGFMGAVLGGFFLTAVPKWTDRTPVTGLSLAVLAAAWLAGRVVLLLDLPGAWQAIDLLFPVGLTTITAIHVFGARSVRNLLFPVLLAAWTGLDVLWHLDSSLPVLRAAVFTLLGVVVIFGGRITPLFTAKALGLELRARDRRDDVAILSVLVLVPAQFVTSPRLVAGLAVFAALANLFRMWGWRCPATLKRPLLLVLHLGYAGLALGLSLEGLSLLHPAVLAPSASLHALTIGALGLFAIGMMARVTRGHTGQPLRAPPTLAVAFFLLPLAASIRVLGPSLWPAWTQAAWLLSGGLWVLAFLLLALVDIPALLRPRVDGKPG